MVEVQSEAIASAQDLVRATEGLDICAASALTVAAAGVLARAGRMRQDAVVLLNLTGADRPPSGRAADFVVERAEARWTVTPIRS